MRLRAPVQAVQPSQRLTTLIEQNSEIKKSVDSMAAKYESLLNKVDVLEKENSQFKTEIRTLENKVELLEKEAKSTSIEIRNIPKADQENKKSLTETVKTIASIVETDLDEGEIKDIFRTKSSAIVVQFTSVIRKQTVISKFKEFNKTKRTTQEAQLNTETLGLQGTAKPVYISDHLTTKSRHIFFLARELIKTKKLVAAWTYHGNIYVKREDSDQPVRISNEQDLENLVS
ncbi:uncharacterized protein LOC135072955 [Ostrinia nubilalis]|uniref:uncharacterized protein LOC135072955 n=1 Tax=Ostrinia nubilalis TaxID=29057 RepID=UPI0030826800